MGMLISGILLWSIVHLMKSVMPSMRANLIAKMGAGPYRGLVSLSHIAALVLIVLGWRSMTAEMVYDPPSWGRHLTMLLMLIAVYLFTVSQVKSRVKSWVRHPALTSMVLWAIGHLLANGDNRSLILFGGLGLWALISLFTVSRNEGPWVKPSEFPAMGREIMTVLIAAVAYVLLVGGHRWFTGVALVGG